MKRAQRSALCLLRHRLALTYWSRVFVLPRVLTGAKRHRLLLTATVACVGIALGAWWEVAEWGFDQIAPRDVIKGKYDTIIDLVWTHLAQCSPGG